MAEMWMLSRAQMKRIEPYFPLSHGVARVDDQRVISGIIYARRNIALLNNLALLKTIRPPPKCATKTLQTNLNRACSVLFEKSFY